MAKKGDKLTTTFSEYVLSELLGQGGSATAWRITSDDGEEVVIKLLRPEAVTSIRRKRFKNEIRFCLNTDHPNVVKVLDHGITKEKNQEVPFYVMPLFEGTLRHHLAKGGIAPEKALGIFSKILDGVEAGHNAGTFHRDLKPENILCSNALDTVVVADWGIAHFAKHFLETAVKTKNQERLANFIYAAPEQRQPHSNDQINGRLVDLYSLGLMLAELFTGKVPLGAGFTKVAEIYPDLKFMDVIIDELIQQDPSKRYQSIDELKKVLTGKWNEHFTRQKLDQAKKKTLGRYEVDNSLVDNPIVINDAKFYDGNLQLSLNQAPPRGWIQVFQTGQYPRTMSTAYGQFQFTFKNKEVSVPVVERDTQTAVDQFKQYCDYTTRIYMDEKVKNMNILKRTDEEEQKRLVEVQEASLRVSQEIKF